MANEKSACEWGWEDNYVDIPLQTGRSYQSGTELMKSSSSRSLQHRVSSLQVGHTFVLAAVCRSGHLCSICSAVWSSRPQLQVGDGTSFIFLKMWALSPCVVS